MHKPDAAKLVMTNDAPAPTHCPTCGLELTHIGHAPQYDHDHSADIYHCIYCETWVDYLIPHQHTRDTDNNAGSGFALNNQ